MNQVRRRMALALATVAVIGGAVGCGEATNSGGPPPPPPGLTSGATGGPTTTTTGTPAGEPAVAIKTGCELLTPAQVKSALNKTVTPEPADSKPTGGGLCRYNAGSELVLTVTVLPLNAALGDPQQALNVAVAGQGKSERVPGVGEAARYTSDSVLGDTVYTVARSGDKLFQTMIRVGSGSGVGKDKLIALAKQAVEYF